MFLSLFAIFLNFVVRQRSEPPVEYVGNYCSCALISDNCDTTWRHQIRAEKFYGPQPELMSASTHQWFVGTSNQAYVVLLRNMALGKRCVIMKTRRL